MDHFIVSYSITQISYDLTGTYHSSKLYAGKNILKYNNSITEISQRFVIIPGN